MSWIKTKNRLPDTDRLCWLYNEETGGIKLGSLFAIENGIYWTISNGYFERDLGRIESDCELDDNYEFTHWQYVPDLP